MESLRLRQAHAADADEIARLRWEFSLEGHQPIESYEAFTRRMAAEVRRYLASGRWSIWVAEHPEIARRLIATLFLQRIDKVPRPYPRPGAWGYITNVFVDARDGRPVNAVHGLVDSMLSLLREPNVTHIAAATDHVIESWRNDVFGGYKSSVGMPPELLAQFEDAERALRALGITTWAMVEDEADDAIATAVARFGDDSRLEQIVICSVDKDLAQCVDDERVVLRDRIRRVTYDEAGVLTKFGVAPASIPDYLALVGDSSDGYPGLAGWGARSSSAIL